MFLINHKSIYGENRMRFDTLFNQYYYKRKLDERVGIKEIDGIIRKTKTCDFWLVCLKISN